MDIKEALTFEGLKYFYTKHIKPLKTRIGQLGSAANCTVVNNATTTTANTVLDGRMGKTLGDRLTTVETRVQNHFDRTGATEYTGEYKSSWTLTTNYQDIGNSRTIDSKYFRASPGNSRLYVKEGGVYLAIAQITVKAHGGYDSIWMKILRNKSEAHTEIRVANGYTTLQCCTVLNLRTNDYMAAEISKSSTSIEVTCDGGGYLQLVKLT